MYTYASEAQSTFFTLGSATPTQLALGGMCRLLLDRYQRVIWEWVSVLGNQRCAGVRRGTGSRSSAEGNR